MFVESRVLLHLFCLVISRVDFLEPTASWFETSMFLRIHCMFYCFSCYSNAVAMIKSIFLMILLYFLKLLFGLLFIIIDLS